MTMPNLHNCPHSPDGWCLDCVAKVTTAPVAARPPFDWEKKGPAAGRIIAADCDSGDVTIRLDDNRWVPGIPMSGVRVALVPVHAKPAAP